MKAIVLLLAFTAFLAAQTAPPNENLYSFKSQWDFYTRRTYTQVDRFAWLAAGVLFDDYVQDDLHEWGSGASGVGKTYLKEYGQRVVTNTMQFAVSAAFTHEDPWYHPSAKKGIIARGTHAALTTFVYKNRSGKWRPAYSSIVGTAFGIIVASRWHPIPATGSTLAGNVLFGLEDKVQNNLITEFTPDMKRAGFGLWRKVRGKI